ncbi:glutamate ABC transporter substrate-binding protein [Acrocarpospora macrocephala]|uniref:ABC transporter substrate-binding protein n=1 Tax=Acrocarpospora macrocephala TaxID=150177 RepID=A0A5M3WUT0_9ACTN|nr:transporter substrate-binding domain-containing protein [Acrocarpospora macrocephala]GES09888.1 ABC transporter substrate-binding protein [Acrocarpospora macrocephala]
MTLLRLIAALTVLTACGATTPETKPTEQPSHTLVGKTTLTIAVKIGPGLMEYVKDDPSSRSGFDADVANYVARQLGATKIAWKDVLTKDREEVLQNGSADLVVATYTMNENRRDIVSFAGPYLIVGQDILIRTADIGKITGLDSLKNRQTCASQGSTSAQRLVQHFGAAWDTPDHLVRENSTIVCRDGLLAGRYDAVSTDNSILVGYAAQHPEQLHLVGQPFTSEEIGIGLANRHAADVPKINEILREMIRSGEGAKSIRKHFGPLADSFLKNVPKPR